MNIDLTEGLARVRNNKAMYSRLIGRFFQNDSVDQLKAAIDEGDAAKIEYCAHTIKGSAVNLGLKELYELAQNLEQQVKSEGANDKTADLFSKLQEHHSGIKENLDTILKANGF